MYSAHFRIGGGSIVSQLSQRQLDAHVRWTHAQKKNTTTCTTQFPIPGTQAFAKFNSITRNYAAIEMPLAS